MAFCVMARPSEGGQGGEVLIAARSTLFLWFSFLAKSAVTFNAIFGDTKPLQGGIIKISLNGRLFQFPDIVAEIQAILAIVGADQDLPFLGFTELEQ